jgi:hypothetical protein
MENKSHHTRVIHWQCESRVEALQKLFLGPIVFNPLTLNPGLRILNGSVITESAEFENEIKYKIFM